jgi:hypothetical protein
MLVDADDADDDADDDDDAGADGLPFSGAEAFAANGLTWR